MTNTATFSGKRADKMTVTGPAAEKEIEYYTIMCETCGGVGRYDKIGDVICEDCGEILAGGPETDPMMPWDHSNSTGYGQQDFPPKGHTVPSTPENDSV